MWNFGIPYLYFSIVRPLYKWLLRLVTGRCELLRITSSGQTKSQQTNRIEYSLRHSKAPLLRNILFSDVIDIDDTIDKICQLKSIKPSENPTFSNRLRSSLRQITGYHQLYNEVEALRKTNYSSASAEHESLLMQLWNSLKPDTPLVSRISQQWGDIGFQGDDPATDFRGMGLLGLKNLVFFSTQYTDVARGLLSHCAHPQYGYSFAIVGINLTSMAYQLLRDGHLKAHFYAVVDSQPQLQDFHLVYVHLFCEFDQFWIRSKPSSIMEFNVIREQFRQTVIEQLHLKCQPLQFRF